MTDDFKDTPSGLLHQPKNTMPRIETIWAFVSVDPEDGKEGVCAARFGGMMLPLIAADPVRLEILREIAEQLVQDSGMTIRLAKFTCREDVETLEGGR